MNETDPNAFEPALGTTIPLDGNVESGTLVEFQHFHTTPVKINAPDHALNPGLNGQRGVVTVAACGIDTERPAIFTPTQARAHALALMSAADVADLGRTDEGIGQALVEALMAGGDPGAMALGVDEEDTVRATVFEMVDADGDELFLALPVNEGFSATVSLIVSDDDGEKFEAAVALTKDQARRLAKVLAAYGAEDEL